MTSVQDVALPSCGLRGMAVSIYMRVEYVDRRGYGCPVAGMELRNGTARPIEKENWMGTQWWREWLAWGLGGGGEIPSSVVGLWSVWKVAPALFTCVNVCVCAGALTALVACVRW
ncbi:uncharacterized protein EMH_0093040 [Eimeria mitis]|uniref:Uncharacterized protein n=1 Tax=Eimeria mitis TaxID=44415 RepID=U6KA11_9EIME|nr:uncharacterized protein EMH_0093040 [Eimeria mitis]CDJ34835.1 hypothetical protein EMH_0093040 [Eimeria mitis]